MADPQTVSEPHQRYVGGCYPLWNLRHFTDVLGIFSDNLNLVHEAIEGKWFFEKQAYIHIDDLYDHDVAFVVEQGLLASPPPKPVHAESWTTAKRAIEALQAWVNPAPQKVPPPDNADGLVPPCWFRYRGKLTPDLAKKQYLLVSVLWDQERGRPADPIPAKELITRLGIKGKTPLRTLKSRRERTDEKLGRVGLEIDQIAGGYYRLRPMQKTS